MINYFQGHDGFVWFTGVVEDRNDPTKLGRVRVRCVGYHTADKTKIPTERILGMGDVVSLVERAQQVFDEEQAKKIQQKVKKNSFGFDDFLAQIRQVQKMGSMKDLVGMIPGANKISPDEIDEDAFKGIEAIIQSMTPKERSQPKLLNHSRKKRIALGSGSNVEDVNRLIKQFEQMQKMMKMVQKGGASKLMQMMKGI